MAFSGLAHVNLSSPTCQFSLWFSEWSYVNVPFSLIILLIIISLENLVLDQLKKSPN